MMDDWLKMVGVWAGWLGERFYMHWYELFRDRTAEREGWGRE